jgi:hypothetical protein
MFFQAVFLGVITREASGAYLLLTRVEAAFRAMTPPLQATDLPELPGYRSSAQSAKKPRDESVGML